MSADHLESASETEGSWLTHGGTFAELRFSSLASIHADNVDRLRLAWSYDFPLRGGVEATPLMSDGVLCLSGPWSTVYALDARSGTLQWRYDPELDRLYAGVGNGSPWNRMIRSPDGGDDLFLASILALRRATKPHRSS